MTGVNDTQGLWDAYYTHAVARVRRGFSPGVNKDSVAHSRFAILHEPSFDDIVGWEVHEIVGDNEPSYAVATRTAWTQSHDSQRIANPVDRLAVLRQRFGGFPQPTIEYATVVPELAFVQKMVRRIDDLRLPLNVKFDHVGMDGICYELILGHYFTQSTLRWWVESPPEWAEAGAIVMETLRHLEALYEER